MQISEETLRWIITGMLSVLVGSVGFILKKAGEHFENHMKSLVDEMKGLNTKVGEILLREAHRDAEVETLKAAHSRLLCVQNGHICQRESRL